MILGGLFSLSIELLQLLTGYVAGITFRIADINDVIFNTTGAAIGCLLFRGLLHVCRNTADKPALSDNPILRYVAERPQRGI